MNYYNIYEFVEYLKQKYNPKEIVFRSPEEELTVVLNGIKYTKQFHKLEPYNTIEDMFI